MSAREELNSKPQRYPKVMTPDEIEAMIYRDSLSLLGL